MSEENVNVKVEAAMKVIMGQLNSLGNTNVGNTIAKVVMEDHRTLQQNFFREINKVFVIYENSYHDLRNEASVKYAQEVSGLDHYFPLV